MSSNLVIEKGYRSFVKIYIYNKIDQSENYQIYKYVVLCLQNIATYVSIITQRYTILYARQIFVFFGGKLRNS